MPVEWAMAGREGELARPALASSLSLPAISPKSVSLR
jgi:hypothetical protein